MSWHKWFRFGVDSVGSSDHMINGIIKDLLILLEKWLDHIDVHNVSSIDWEGSITPEEEEALEKITFKLFGFGIIKLAIDKSYKRAIGKETLN